MVETVTTYRLSNEWIQLDITNVGASIISLKVKDKEDSWQDIMLGFETAEEYLTENEPSLGTIVGRNANRIKHGELLIDETSYSLDKNDGENNLHSGLDRYHTRLWKLENQSNTELKFSLFSPDGDQGYPGNMTISVTYELVENSMYLRYSGISDQPTIFNLTNHSYFNLNGHQNGHVLNHFLKIPSKTFMPLAKDSVPLGQKKSVKGTAMDFLESKEIKYSFDFSDEQLMIGQGYDHYFLLDNPEDAVEIYSPQTGISMRLTTDLPGFQLYTGNYLENIKGKEGAIYDQQAGFCLETQFCPNAVNIPDFEQSPLIQPDVLTEYETIWTFGIK